MRAILVAAAMAAGVGLLGTSAAFAAPANGSVMRDLNTATSNVQDVRYCRIRCWHRAYSRRVCRRWCGG